MVVISLHCVRLVVVVGMFSSSVCLHVLYLPLVLVVLLVLVHVGGEVEGNVVLLLVQQLDSKKRKWMKSFVVVM